MAKSADDMLLLLIVDFRVVPQPGLGGGKIIFIVFFLVVGSNPVMGILTLSKCSEILPK